GAERLRAAWPRFHAVLFRARLFFSQREPNMVRSEAPPEDGRLRVLIEAVLPEIDAGAHPVKRVVGDLFNVSADLVADGHDVLGGALLYRRPGDDDWRTTPLRELVNDRWEASILLDELGTWHYTVEGWVDHAATWRKH